MRSGCAPVLFYYFYVFLLFCDKLTTKKEPSRMSVPNWPGRGVVLAFLTGVTVIFGPCVKGITLEPP